MSFAIELEREEIEGRTRRGMTVATAVVMEAVAKADEALASGVEPQATFCSKADEHFSKGDRLDGLSRIEKRKRFGGACRVAVFYLRKMSLVKVLKKVRDCYVATLGSCAQNYGTTYPPYGAGMMGCHASSLPPSQLRMSMRNDDLHGTEFCLSPAFKKSLNESLLVLKRSAFLDSESGSSPFRKSFSDFESCLSPVMKRTYSDAATLYSRSPGHSRAAYCLRSPGWTPTRALGGQGMMIFPIHEAPEVILASFRKEAQDLHLASFRKEGAVQLQSVTVTADANSAVSNLQVKEVPEANHGPTPSPTAV